MKREEKRLMFTPETPHFFKIILKQTVLNGKLGIPRKFVEKYGNRLPSQALLQVPSGAVWKVELLRSDGRIWLGKGWQQFAEYYSLRRGHFLVFRNERKNGHFHVLIFDMSASEVEYRFTNSADAVKHFGSEAEENASIEIPEGIAPCNKKRTEKSPIQCPRPPKMMKTNMTRGIKHGNVNKHTSPSRSEQRFSGLKPCKGIRRGMDNESEQAHHILRFKKLAAEEKARAFQIANAFKSENPFFLIVTHQSYISSRCLMGIPGCFSKKYLKDATANEVTLCLNLDGKTWSLKYYHKYNGSIAQICWREFVLDNPLEPGDVCVFELLKATDIILFKVMIHRDVNDPNRNPSLQDNKRIASVDCRVRLENLESEVNYGKACTSSQRKEHGNRNVFSGDDAYDDEAGKFTNPESVTPKGNKDGLKLRKGTAAGAKVSHEASGTFTSKHPFFKRILLSSMEKYSRVDVPRAFIEKYFEADVEEVMLQVADRVWPVKLKRYVYRKIRQCKLSCGWSKFAKENSIKVGDVCVFERIALTNAVLKVSIFGHGS